MDFAVGSYHHVGANFASLCHCAATVHKYVADIIWVTFDVVIVQESLLPDDVVPWLADIEPKIVVQGQTVEMSLVRELREDLLFNHAVALGNSVEN